MIDILTLLFIALGLAMDAFAVSIGSGVTLKRRRLHHALSSLSKSSSVFQSVDAMG